MKFTQYQPAIQPTTISGGGNKAPADAAAYGAPQVNPAATNYGAWAGALDTANKVVRKRQTDEDAMDLMAARNELQQDITTKLYSAEDGLITTGIGVNARGLSDRVVSAIKDSVSEISGKYNSRVRQALADSFDENISNYQRIAATQEASEKNKVDQANLKTACDLAIDSAGSDYKDAKLYDTAANEIKKNWLSFGIAKGLTGQQQVAGIRGETTRLASTIIDAAVADNDTGYAYAFLASHKNDMDIATYNKYYGNLKQAQEKKNRTTAAKSIADQFCGRNSFDYTGAKAYIDAMTTNGYSANANLDNAVKQAQASLVGQTMANGTLGCAEAATQIAGYWSEWARKQYGSGTFYVPTLMQNAQTEGGPGMIDYSHDKLSKGDIIVYDNGKHVVVYTGSGGDDYSYTGNSSSQNQIINDGDYREMGGQQPTHIIKTGGNPSPRVMTDDEKDALWKQVKQEIAERETLYKKDQSNKYENAAAQIRSLVSNGQYGAAQEVRDSSGCDDVNMSKLQSIIDGAVNRTSRSSGGSSGYSGVSTASSRAITSASTDLRARVLEIEGGKWPTEKQFTEMDNDFATLIPAGSEAEADFRETLSQVNDKLTDYMDVGDNIGAINYLRAALSGSDLSEMDTDTYIGLIMSTVGRTYRHRVNSNRNYDSGETD